MATKKQNKYIVTTAEPITLPFRNKPEILERRYEVYAYSVIQARKSVHGKVIKVEKQGK